MKIVQYKSGCAVFFLCPQCREFKNVSNLTPKYRMGRTAEEASCRLGNRERGLGRMKVLLIKPMEHPQVVDIEKSLKEF